MIVEHLPRAFEEIEHLWITLRDGCRLAARAWLPDGGARPCPAIIEYIPYRKRDGTRPRDEGMHRWFAGHGFACLRVDLRGSGESDGVLEDEYLEREQLDGVELIAWAATQPWCSGAVGMIGKSWGGFNALQIAARRPPALKAIVTVCASDDRYADDAHYMGGCLLNESLIWGSFLLTLTALPPDPDLVADWRAVWMQRLHATRLQVETWLRHPRRDAYWKQGSVCEDYARIACPVLAVGGLADGYTNAVPRLMAGLRVPRRGIIGPWGHAYPHEALPGPAMGFLQEARRWFDQWLRGTDTGVLRDPLLRVWLQEWTAPRPGHLERPGRMVAEDAWPPVGREPARLGLEPGRIVAAPVDSRAVVTVHSPCSTGTHGGLWCSFGEEGDEPDDQREDDARSAVFDSEPLGERREILGQAALRIEVSVPARTAQLAVRLCDVAPDGSSLRVAYGLLNLAHRDGHERPTALVPGVPVKVHVVLGFAAHAFPPGHRIRLAVSSAYWPIAWPAPYAAPVSLHLSAAVLELPLRPPQPGDAAVQPLPPPEAAPRTGAVAGSALPERRAAERDPASGRVTLRVTSGEDCAGQVALRSLPAIDLRVGHAVRETFMVEDGDPRSARTRVEHRVVRRRGSFHAEVATELRMECTEHTFDVHARVEARAGAERVFERTFEARVPRDLV